MVDLELLIIYKVARLRRQRGLLQADLGRVLQVSPSFIGNIENPKSTAKYNIKHICLLAEYFNLPTIYFFMSDEDFAKIAGLDIGRRQSMMSPL